METQLSASYQRSPIFQHQRATRSQDSKKIGADCFSKQTYLKALSCWELEMFWLIAKVVVA